jgi:hypothetical protein
MLTTYKCNHALLVVLLPLISILAPQLGACGRADADAEGRALPSDDRVIADVTPANDDNVVSVNVVEGRQGESYLHRGDLEWYFDRGVVVKRKAGMSGAPDAVVVVGGLARYVLVGDRYEYRKFLTTYNEYEGVPAPDEDALTDYVRDHLTDVFVSRDHTIVAVDSVDLNADKPWRWHSAKSFTAQFTIAYKHITSYTAVETRQDNFDIRFYRDSVTSPIQNLMATEASRKQLGTEEYPADAIRNMKTLRSGSL